MRARPSRKAKCSSSWIRQTNGLPSRPLGRESRRLPRRLKRAARNSRKPKRKCNATASSSTPAPSRQRCSKIAKLRVDSLRKQAEAVEAETRVSQAEAQVSGQQLRNLRIVSPIAGTAVTKPAQLGDVVGATMTLVELVPFDSLLVEVDVPEARLSQVKTDGPCEVVLDAAPNERLRGKVADFTPRMNRAKATATVKVKLVERPARLWPEMSARVSFLAAEVDEKLRKQPAKKVVARAAIVQVDGRPAVWVVEDKKVRKVPVSLGQAMGSNVEVMDGPGPGTLVVLSPPDDLRAGQTIKNASPSDS
ncbi:MAG: efflux RND transporter periplasmic adaptor subunit [Polyangiaceae bacterium]